MTRNVIPSPLERSSSITMQGPYISLLVANSGDVLADFAESDLTGSSAQSTAHRFYQDATPGLVDGSLRCAVFAAAALLEPGESCDVVVMGRVAGAPTECRRVSARRDSAGRFLSTLGSRFNERHFVGV